MGEKKKVSVKIFGSEYVMTGDNSEEYIKEIASKVDNIMTEISKSNYKYSPTMIAILTALNLADVLYKTQEQLSDISDKYEAVLADMQKPYEELDNLKNELDAVKEQYTKMQSDFTKTQIELGKANKELLLTQELLKDAKCEVDVSKETIEELQNKLFENQIELLKMKKELDDKRRIGNNKGR